MSASNMQLQCLSLSERSIAMSRSNDSNPRCCPQPKLSHFIPASCSQHTPAPVRCQSLPHPHPHICHAQFLDQLLIFRPHTLCHLQHCRWREQQCLPDVQIDNGPEDLFDVSLRLITDASHAREMGFESCEPFRRGEAMHDRHAAKIK